MTPQKVQEEVKTSGLRGRGGAGFPTGLKWSFTPMGTDTPRPKYVIANADEMEPGTFKDRHLMEGNPHQLIEGLILAAYANEADIAFIFIRGEYKLSQERLARAIAEAYSAGYLGKDILKSGYALEMYLHISAGRYMCGEETGLLNALEGKRANPRAKPPFPQVSGLWGKPTIVNNVETLVNVPHIIEKGAAWFQSLGRTRMLARSSMAPAEKSSVLAYGNCRWAPRCARSWRSTQAACAMGCGFEEFFPAAPPQIFSSKNISMCQWITPKSKRPGVALGLEP